MGIVGWSTQLLPPSVNEIAKTLQEILQNAQPPYFSEIPTVRVETRLFQDMHPESVAIERTLPTDRKRIRTGAHADYFNPTDCGEKRLMPSLSAT